MNSLLKVENVVKNYGDFCALNKVSIDVPQGSIFGLLGPNGAGKTTLIRIINQITGPDEGHIYLDGEKLKPSHIASIGYLPEERGLYKNMKVGEQAIYLAQLKGMSKADAKAKLKMWFDKFDIGDWWGKKVQELSKGMAQKVQFIVTVLHEPKLLIFDEPFSGFDPINANLIRDEILSLRDKGATIIFSTHRMESVEEVCDHIALINKANKILDGNLNTIKKQFKTNTFEVGLVANDLEALKSEIASKFVVQPAEFKSLNHDLKLNIKLAEKESSNDLLNYLSSKASINHFVELIPSANDIFIQAINNNTHV
ncbi:MAG: ATP-binding cassette domain-containing protein [Flavobacteriaceae bacterium]|nr:ATP-binding cassette domain-containing protein [Flavobacteriaceae bacterium]